MDSIVGLKLWDVEPVTGFVGDYSTAVLEFEPGLMLRDKEVKFFTTFPIAGNHNPVGIWDCWLFGQCPSELDVFYLVVGWICRECSEKLSRQLLHLEKSIPKGSIHLKILRRDQPTGKLPSPSQIWSGLISETVNLTAIFYSVDCEMNVFQCDWGSVVRYFLWIAKLICH